MLLIYVSSYYQLYRILIFLKIKYFISFKYYFRI